jgi:hypothetical protein
VTPKPQAYQRPAAIAASQIDNRPQPASALILRSIAKRCVSKNEAATWFETRCGNPRLPQGLFRRRALRPQLPAGFCAVRKPQQTSNRQDQQFLAVSAEPRYRLERPELHYFHPSLQHGLAHDMKGALLPGDGWTPGRVGGAPLVSSPA